MGIIDPSFGYFRLGTETGSNLHIWKVAVPVQAERVRAALAAMNQPGADDEAGLRLDAEVHFLLVSVRNGIRFAEQVQDVVKDARLGEALAAFVRAFPDARDLRDIYTHMEEYVLDRGRLQPEGGGKRRGEVDAGTPSWWQVVDDDIVLHFGKFAVPALTMAAEADRVLTVAYETWLQGLRDEVDLKPPEGQT